MLWGATLVLLFAGCGPVRPTRQTVPRLMGQGAAPPPVPRDGNVPELIGAWYSVERGDTITSIAGRHGVPPEDLLELNGIVDPRRLSVGRALFVYGVDEIIRRHTRPRKPKRGGSKAKGTKKPRTSKKPGNKAGTSTVKKPKKLLAWPIKAGRTTSGFGPRWGRMHRGLDVAAPIGTPVLAAADGKVIYSDNKQRGYGNLVIIQHSTGLITVYAHNRRNLVDEGKRVRQGAKIAELGNTGRSTGPHLHFEVRVDGKAADPIKYLPKWRDR
jgi:murein DD-endopeptidase MepM/ murein hydrolase activator NlpD